eukprot:scaffold211011_cov45-Prasinocladus_malaysianus.AAC.1
MFAPSQARQSLKYYNGAEPASPTVPPTVVSRADIWGGPIGCVVTEFDDTIVTLRAKNEGGGSLLTTITSLPEFGSLYQALDSGVQDAQVLLGDSVPSMSLLYKPHNFSEFLHDSFEYTVENEQGENSTAE